MQKYNKQMFYKEKGYKNKTNKKLKCYGNKNCNNVFAAANTSVPHNTRAHWTTHRRRRVATKKKNEIKLCQRLKRKAKGKYRNKNNQSCEKSTTKQNKTKQKNTQKSAKTTNSYKNNNKFAALSAAKKQQWQANKRQKTAKLCNNN